MSLDFANLQMLLNRVKRLDAELTRAKVELAYALVPSMVPHPDLPAPGPFPGPSPAKDRPAAAQVDEAKIRPSARSVDSKILGSLASAWPAGILSVDLRKSLKLEVSNFGNRVHGLKKAGKIRAEYGGGPQGKLATYYFVPPDDPRCPA